jgi:hypothetical protein
VQRDPPKADEAVFGSAKMPDHMVSAKKYRDYFYSHLYNSLKNNKIFDKFFKSLTKNVVAAPCGNAGKGRCRYSCANLCRQAG